MSDGYTCPVRVTYDARLANLKAFFVVEVAKKYLYVVWLYVPLTGHITI